MLYFELFIGLGRYLYFIADTVIYLRLGLNCTPYDLICENCLIDYAVEGAGGGEVLVVGVTSLSWIYSYKVSTLLVLLT